MLKLHHENLLPIWFLAIRGTPVWTTATRQRVRQRNIQVCSLIKLLPWILYDSKFSTRKYAFCETVETNCRQFFTPISPLIIGLSFSMIILKTSVSKFSNIFFFPIVNKIVNVMRSRVQLLNTVNTLIYSTHIFTIRVYDSSLCSILYTAMNIYKLHSIRTERLL